MKKTDCPKVVIGVCTYNRCKDLRRLLQSLIKLDYPNFEIIVVDNNSTDQTAQIVSGFEKVKYVFEEKQGLAYARNCLLNKCGKVCMVLQQQQYVRQAENSPAFLKSNLP